MGHLIFHIEQVIYHLKGEDVVEGAMCDGNALCHTQNRSLYSAIEVMGYLLEIFDYQANSKPPT